jgi:hypothetical protein
MSCRQNRQCLHQNHSSLSPYDMRGQNIDDNYAVSLPDLHSSPFQTTIQDPSVSPPCSTCRISGQPKYSKGQAQNRMSRLQYKECPPAATQVSLSSSTSSYYTPTSTSISEVDSKPGQPFATRSDFLVVVEEGPSLVHVTQQTSDKQSENPWDAIESYLNDPNDPFIKALEAIDSTGKLNLGEGGVQLPLTGPNFEDSFFVGYNNANNMGIELGQIGYSGAIMESPGFKDMAHSGTISANIDTDNSLQASRDTIPQVPSFSSFGCYGAHHEGVTANFTLQPSEQTARLTSEEEDTPDAFTRPSAPSGYESLQRQQKVNADGIYHSALTGGAQGHHGQYYCDRGVVEPYPNPPVSSRERQTSHMSARDRDQAADILLRRCSTASAASTRNSYGRDMYDSGLLGAGAGIGRRASAISSTSQSSRFSTLHERVATNAGAGNITPSSTRRYSDDLRRRESQNSATSSRRGGGLADDLRFSTSSYGSRSRSGSGLYFYGTDRKADAGGTYNRNSLYGFHSLSAAARAGSGSGAGEGAGKSEHEKTLDILVEKMSGARIQC